MSDSSSQHIPSLLNLFNLAGTEEIPWQDRTVRKFYRRQLEVDTVVRFKFVEWTVQPVQGLAVGMRGGILELLGHGSEFKGVWRDTAPDEFELVARPPSAGGEFVAWNEWRLPNGSTLARLGNAGMAVEQEDKFGVRLCCSDGEGDVNFENLVVDLSFHSA